jgi:predicted nucleotidyltransferase
MLMSSDLQNIRRCLSSAREDLFRRYPIRRLGIFGSFARGDAYPDSDIDILVEFSEPVGFEIVDLAMELEALLGHTVDLVSRHGVRDRLLPYVERDLVYV